MTFEQLMSENFTDEDVADIKHGLRLDMVRKNVDKFITAMSEHYSPADTARVLEEALEDLWAAVTEQ